MVELKRDAEKISDALEQLKSSLSDFESKAIPEYASKYGKTITWTGCIFCNDEELLQSPYYPYYYIQETLETENQNKPPVFYDLDLFINDCRIEKHLRSVFSRIDKI